MLLNRDLQKRPEVLRDSSPETNTEPYWVTEKFKFGTFHCPCSLLGVSDGRVINSEYLTQTVLFCSYWQHMLLTLLNWSTTMKSLNALPKFENHFVVKTVRFQVQLEADGYFFFRKFLSLQPQQSGRVGTNSQFLNQIFQIRLQKYLLGFSQTRHSAQNCAE